MYVQECFGVFRHVCMRSAGVCAGVCACVLQACVQQCLLCAGVCMSSADVCAGVCVCVLQACVYVCCRRVCVHQSHRRRPARADVRLHTGQPAECVGTQPRAAPPPRSRRRHRRSVLSPSVHCSQSSSSLLPTFSQSPCLPRWSLIMFLHSVSSSLTR